MQFEINSAKFILNRQKSGRTEFDAGFRREEGEWAAESEGMRAALRLEEKGDCVLGCLELSLKTEPFRENDTLALLNPVTVCLETEKPVRMTALYLHRDWWTRPAFVEKWEELPERTQCVYLEYPDGYGCLMLLAGNEYKTNAAGREEGKLCLSLTAYKGGQSHLKEPLFVWAKKDSVYEAAHACALAAAEKTGAILKERKEYPRMFDYLGWCSWDAFYTDISEEKVRAKAEELREKNVPVRWLLLDDGWQSVHGQTMYDLVPEKEKFPEGFAKMIRQIKESGSVDYVGVWHALGGYWGGVEPGSEAAVRETDHLYQTTSGKLLPYPDAEKGYGFYRDWYEILRREGIDFVKVDGQSAIKNYYENDIPVCRAARETHRALEGAAGAYMGGRLINCMGMAMENVLGRQGSAMSRNSDDFVPDRPEGFTEHLLQNAYNAVYHDEFYYCDWDMFWTCHPDAKKHALLRAVSGGPVYFSDRIGDTDRDAVLPLIEKDGKLLRMNRAAKPAPDCLFADPCRGGLMKLTNVASCGQDGPLGGAVLVYNISGQPGSASVSAADVYDLPDGDYYCYDWDAGRGKLLRTGESLPVELEADGFALYLLLPAVKGRALIGLTDKYVSFLGIERAQRTANGFQAMVKEGKTFAFYSPDGVKRCLVNGQDVTETLREEDGLYRVICLDEGETMILVEEEE